jgi:EAL domain-containing protein (putative c-di-GMP-specific phosphodiesterase class I)
MRCWEGEPWPEPPAAAGREHGLRDEVRELVEASRFGVQYEPVIELASGRPCAFEALARFHARDGALLENARVFAALHAEPALFARLEVALKRLQLERAPGQRLFLNVDPDSYAACRALGLPLRALLAARRDEVVVELIENEGRSDAGRIRAMIRELSREGLAVALDDVGAPNALLSLESLLYVQYVKLDRTTLRAAADPRHRALVESLLGLARRLGARSVLEGVETTADFVVARDLGIDLVQGYLFRDRARVAGR